MSTLSSAAKRPTEGKDEKRDEDVAAADAAVAADEIWMEPRESCDAELLIGGTSVEEAKQRIHVHKLIVSQFAPVLGAMLSCGDKSVHLSGCLKLPLDVMPALVHLIYKPHAASSIVTDTNARAITQLARYFDAATPRMMVDRHMASSYARYLHECMTLVQSSRVVTETRSDGSEHKWTLERFNAKHEFSMARTVNSANRQTTAKARLSTAWCRVLDPVVPDTPAFVAPQGSAELLVFAIDHQLPELARWRLLLLRVEYLVESPVGSNFIYADAKTGKPVNAFKMLTADQLRAFLVPVVQKPRDTSNKNLVLPFPGSAGGGL